MAEIFPDSWRRPGALPFVIDMLNGLPLSRKDRKRTFEEWAHWAGVKLTAKMVERATRLPSGETTKPVVRRPAVLRRTPGLLGEKGEEMEGGGKGG